MKRSFDPCIDPYKHHVWCVDCDTWMHEAEFDVPPVSDDAAWQWQARLHAAGCEWVRTRAHRVFETAREEEA